MCRLARYTKPISAPLILLIAVLLLDFVGAEAASEPKAVSFDTSDGGVIHADLYGDGERAVLLAHGKVFDKESWSGLAKTLASLGWQVLAIDFRGYGQSTAGSEGTALDLDILGAVEFLQQEGVAQISLLGASMGGAAVGRAACRVKKGQLETVILLAPGPIPDPSRIRAERIGFIVSKDEPGVDRVRQMYSQAPDPKSLELLEGSAHAQHVFTTDQAQALTKVIVRFLEP